MSIPVKKRPKCKVMFTIDQELLMRLDAIQARLELPRSALIVQAILEWTIELERSETLVKDAQKAVKKHIT